MPEGYYYQLILILAGSQHKKYTRNILVAVNCSIQASSDRYSGSTDIVNPERGTNQYSCEQTLQPE